MSGKNKKNTGKVREFRQRKKVGTLKMKDFQPIPHTLRNLRFKAATVIFVLIFLLLSYW